MSNHCTAYDSYYHYITRADPARIMDAVTCPLIDGMGGGATGEMLLMGIVFGALGISFYMYSRSIGPVVILTIFGGAMFLNQMPASAQQFAGIILLFSVTIGGYAIWRRAGGSPR